MESKLNNGPIFTKEIIIPKELNLPSHIIVNMDDNKFKEYVEKLRSYFISLHKGGHPVFSTNKTENEILLNFKKYLEKYNDSETLKLLVDNKKPNSLFGEDINKNDKLINKMLFYSTKNTNAINHWFPEIWDTKISTGKAITDQFYNETDFFKNLHAIIKKDRFKVAGKNDGRYFIDKYLITCLRIVNGNQPVYNFPSTLARWIYLNRAKKKTESNELWILDTSMGWGGRLLGSLGTEFLLNNQFGNHNTKVYYHGTDVNTIVHDRFNMFVSYWDEKIRKLDNFDFYKSIQPAELIFNDDFFANNRNKYDIMFTSPPYFNKEMYSDDTNQSYLTYNNNYNQWKKGFLTGMLSNTYELLKNGGEAWINIADVKYKGSKYHPLEEDTIKIANDIGFKYINKYYMVFGIMPGLDKRSKKQKAFNEFKGIKETVNKNTKGNNPITKNSIEYDGKKYKYEPIFVFEK